MSGSPGQAGSDAAEAAAAHVPSDGNGGGGGNGVAHGAAASASGGERLAGLTRLARGRSALWAAVALACVAVGTVASVLVANSVADKDATKARQAFHQSVTSTGIASTVRLAVQQEEDLQVSASTFFAANPRASASEFTAWAGYANALRRYPELQKLGFVAFVKAPEPVISTPRVALGASSLRLRSAQRTTSALRTVVTKPAPSYFCVAVAQLARGVRGGAASSGGRCALSHRLLSARDTGTSTYSPAKVGHTAALSIVTPVYHGGGLPSSVAARRGAFAGWLREVLVPGVVLAEALRGHPEGAVRVRYRAPGANVAFAAGAPQQSAQSTTTDLHDGWTVRSFGPVAPAGLFGDGHALVLMGAGVLLSLLLGLLIFILGTRVQARIAPARPARGVPHEDLYDPLTGLPNRALMLDRAERLLSRAGRESGLLAGALFIDIDWFKDVNEKIGESAGEQLLTIVADRLSGVIRAQDSVGRLGGDEFVVLVESAARGARLESLARRIIEALHKPVELDDFGPSFYVTASIGVAFGRYESADDLLRDARLAMYAAKSAGKDRYTLFNANMRSVTESRAVLEVELNTALQERQFFLLYEPIYDLRTRKVAALEALVRWMHPVKGVLDPSEFIPLAEETGLIVPIGRWMMEEACTRAAAWNVGGHRIGMSVEVSASQLNREGFVTDVRRALQQSGLEPAMLTLEIAETTVMQDIAAAAERLREIKGLGVRIAIDDFGSAYAYHSDLQRLPLDYLKVDRSSLAASEDEAYRRWLLEAILIVGRDLSLAVIANGIEDYQQMTTLQVMGCSMAQGPFMGRPTPVDAIATVLDAPFPSAPAAPAASYDPLAVAGAGYGPPGAVLAGVGASVGAPGHGTGEAAADSTMVPSPGAGDSPSVPAAPASPGAGEGPSVPAAPVEPGAGAAPSAPGAPSPGGGEGPADPASGAPAPTDRPS
ncbi:MAG TPA: EAL domain-containing protein [Solirubrobacteraceae bacterium]